MDKTVASAVDAIADISAGASLAVGGFGLTGVPIVLIRALLAGGADNLEVVSNNCGVDGWGLGELLSAGRIRRVIASYVGENREFARQYLGGEVEVELTPQGTLAERLRAGGVGIPAFYTATGVGTMVSEGGLPWRYSADGSVAVASEPKETRTLNSLGAPREYVLEQAIRTDFSLVRAARGDRHGNLIFEKSTRNFNPVAAMAGRICIAEVDELVEPGELGPDDIHLPGIYVDRIVELSRTEAADLPIEKVTVRQNPALHASAASHPGQDAQASQDAQAGQDAQSSQDRRSN
jgi:3-oxoacid CoA-transferase subunit A